MVFPFVGKKYEQENEGNFEDGEGEAARSWGGRMFCAQWRNW